MTTLTAGSPLPGGAFPLLDRPVARIGYGMGRLARAAGDESSRADALALLRTALDLGISHFDTARFYGNGLANDLLREAFSGSRDEVVLASKAGTRPDPGADIPLTAAQKPAELRTAVEENLRSLGTDRIDVMYLRRMDFTPGLLAEGDQVVLLEDQLAEMIALREEGKILGIGLSHVTGEQLRAALPAGIVSVQNIYNLVDVTDEPLLETCAEHGIAWTPYFPLGGGFGQLPRVTDDETVRAVAARLGVTASQVGLAWQVAHSPNTLVISGTASPEHLRENVEAGRITLDPEAMTALDAAARAAR
jgi:aryl-alcohol dehydrogenase-like predicted oxidoreductase